MLKNLLIIMLNNDQINFIIYFPYSLVTIFLLYNKDTVTD